MRRLRGLPSLVALALALRIALAVAAWCVQPDLRTWSLPDTESYVAPARSLLRSGSFAVGPTPEIMRTPGFPVLLLPGLAAGPWKPATFSLQLGLAALTTCLVARIARAWTGSERVGWTAAGLYACDPLSITYAVLLMPETLFACLIALAVASAQEIDARGWRAGLLAGAALGAATLVRPIALYLWAVWGVAFAVQGPRVRPAALIALCVAALLPPAAWRMRNAAAADYRGLASIAEVNAYFYSAAATLAAEQGRAYYDVQRELGYLDEGVYRARHPEQRDWSQAQRSQFYRDEAGRILSEAPLTATRIHLAGVVRLLVDPGAADLLRLLDRYPTAGGMLGRAVDEGLVAAALDLFRERPLTAAVSVLLGLWLAVYYALAAAGLMRERGRAPFPWLVLLTIGYFALASGGPQALARFRVPIVPLVCALGGGIAAPRGEPARSRDPA